MKANESHISVRKSARIYMIGDAQAAAGDVWIVCHGYAQLAGRFVQAFEKIASPQRLIVAPEALHRFYIDPPPMPAAKRRVGATWMTREDRDTDIADNIAYLDAVAAQVCSPNTSRLRALGFSQGCATVFRWAALGSAKIDEVILWAGEVPDDVDLKRAAERLAGRKVLLVQGARDASAPRAATERHLALLRAAGIAAELHEHDGGHHLDSALLNRLANHG